MSPRRSWVIGGRWAASPTVQRKIDSAGLVSALLRLWARGGRP